MNTFVIADTHFGHANILTYEPIRRTWGCATVEEMDRVLVDAWNSVVGPNDLVIHVGDFHLGTQQHGVDVRKRLNGRVLLVRGNHDRRSPPWLLPGDEHVAGLALGQLMFRHAPSKFTVEDLARSDLLVHGHLHSNQHRGDTPEAVRAKAVCVSVERIGPAPVPLHELAAIAAAQRGSACPPA